MGRGELREVKHLTYLKEKKSTEILKVAASEIGRGHIHLAQELEE